MGPLDVPIRPNVHDLHQALRTDNLDDVSDILDLDTVDINRTVCGTTALSLSLYKNNMALFKLLLLHPKVRKRLDVNRISKDEKARVEPPLVTACRLGNREAVCMLIDSGVDISCTDNFNHCPLWMATRQRHTDMVEFLIHHGADVNPSMLWTHSPLFFAVKYSSKRTDIATLLIKHGGCVNIEKGPSLLYCSILQGVLSIAHLVVEAGYQVSHDEKLRSELMTGTLTRNKQLIDWLEEEFSNPIPLKRQCRTVIRHNLAHACQGKHFLSFLESLIYVPIPKQILTYLKMDHELMNVANYHR